VPRECPMAEKNRQSQSQRLSSSPEALYAQNPINQGFPPPAVALRSVHCDFGFISNLPSPSASFCSAIAQTGMPDLVRRRLRSRWRSCAGPRSDGRIAPSRDRPLGPHPGDQRLSRCPRAAIRGGCFAVAPRCWPLRSRKRAPSVVPQGARRFSWTAATSFRALRRRTWGTAGRS
jgi:hypothetical protein